MSVSGSSGNETKKRHRPRPVNVRSATWIRLAPGPRRRYDRCMLWRITLACLVLAGGGRGVSANGRPARDVVDHVPAGPRERHRRRLDVRPGGLARRRQDLGVDVRGYGRLRRDVRSALRVQPIGRAVRDHVQRDQDHSATAAHSARRPAGSTVRVGEPLGAGPRVLLRGVAGRRTPRSPPTSRSTRASTTARRSRRSRHRPPTISWWQTLAVAPSDAQRSYLTGYTLHVRWHRHRHRAADRCCSAATTAATSWIAGPDRHHHRHVRGELGDRHRRDRQRRTPTTCTRASRSTTTRSSDSLYRSTDNGVTLDSGSTTSAAAIKARSSFARNRRSGRRHAARSAPRSRTTTASPGQRSPVRRTSPAWSRTRRGEVWACTQNYGVQQPPADDAGIMKTTDLVDLDQGAALPGPHRRGAAARRHRPARHLRRDVVRGVRAARLHSRRRRTPARSPPRHRSRHAAARAGCCDTGSGGASRAGARAVGCCVARLGRRRASRPDRPMTFHGPRSPRIRRCHPRPARPVRVSLAALVVPDPGDAGPGGDAARVAACRARSCRAPRSAPCCAAATSSTRAISPTSRPACTRASCCSTSRSAATCARCRGCCATRRASCGASRRGDFRDIPGRRQAALPGLLPPHVPLADRRLLQRALGRGLRARRRAAVPRHRRRHAPPGHPAGDPRFVRAAGGARPLRLLDVACGTGRTLHQLARAHPALRLYGVDLSPAYVRLARQRLADVAEVALAVENAEALPYADAHVRRRDQRLPVPRAAAQRAPQRRCARCSAWSAPAAWSSSRTRRSSPRAPRSRPRCARSRGEFHEPFYADYLEDDLAALLARGRLRRRVDRAAVRRQGRHRPPAVVDAAHVAWSARCFWLVTRQGHRVRRRARQSRSTRERSTSTTARSTTSRSSRSAAKRPRASGG